MFNLKKKLKEKKGFTLAELLIVVAIIAVLVAVSIPIFTAQLEKAREATDLANLRAAKAEAAVSLLDADTKLETAKTYFYDGASGTLVDTATDATKIGKGTATKTGATYTDAEYAQFSYDGSDVKGHSITVTPTIPTDGTEPSVVVKFN